MEHNATHSKVNLERKCTVQKIPEVTGCYGERWFIRNGDTKVHQFFETISLWPTSVYSSEDKDFIKGYELPIGLTLNINDPLIKFVFEKLKIEIKKEV